MAGAAGSVPLLVLLSLLSLSVLPGATLQVELAEIFRAGEKDEAGFPVFGYRIPGFVAARNASSAGPPVLVVLAEARKYTNSDEGAHNLVAKRSTSGGASWGPSQTVVEPPKLWGKQEGGIKGGAVYDPTPVFDAVTGAIRVIFSYCPARYMSRPPISRGTSPPFCRRRPWLRTSPSGASAPALAVGTASR